MRPMLKLIGTAALALASQLALAQTYPSQIVKLVAPYAAGGPADLLAREIARALSDTLGQQVIVEPRPGGGATIGADYVAKAQPDGYTILVSTAATHIVSPAMLSSRLTTASGTSRRFACSRRCQTSSPCTLRCRSRR